MTYRDSRRLAALARAQLRYKAAQARAEQRRKARDARLEAARHLLPSGEWVSAAGFLVKLTIGAPSERFRLADYRRAGGQVTRRMSQFVTKVDGRRDLTVCRDDEAFGS